MSESTFTERPLRVVGKTVHRLGLSGSFGIDHQEIVAALEGPINYVYWSPSMRQTTKALREVTPRLRDRLIIATGPSLGFFGFNIRRRVERVLKLLKTDYIDVLQLYWLSKMSAWTSSTVEEMVKLRSEGKVRALGVSIHDRPRAAKLAEDSPLDLLMLRYNAAHPGAERDVFPHLDKRKPSVIAYTATSWGRLLKRPSGWGGQIMTPGDCYRFCLSNPNVDVVLTGPANSKELQENLRSLEKGPLSPTEMRWMREFGEKVHG